jgi:hypothetical protein
MPDLLAMLDLLAMPDLLAMHRGACYCLTGEIGEDRRSAFFSLALL